MTQEHHKTLHETVKEETCFAFNFYILLSFLYISCHLVSSLPLLQLHSLPQLHSYAPDSPILVLSS